MAGAAKRITLPRINTGTPPLVVEESVEIRLKRAVADVLNVEIDTIQLFDSFCDLGGDQRSAMALRKTCMNVGMEVKTKDILGCQTLAELQTQITPCARPSIVARPSVDSLVVAPLKIQSSSSSSQPSNSSREHSREHSRTSSLATSTCASDAKNEMEEFLSSSSIVGRSVVIKPRAGLLDGKLVALVTLTGLPTQAEAVSEVEMIPQSQMFFAGTQVAAIRQGLRALGTSHDLPDVWVILDGMPLTEAGEIDRRQLRTWTQNVNEETHRRILSLDTHEASQAPATEMERSLQRLVAIVLSVPQEQVGMNFTFTQLGGDEMAALQLVGRAKLESINLNTNEILQRNTIGQLALQATQRGGLAHKWTEESFDAFELSPMQHLYFQTPMGKNANRRATGNGTYRFNQSLLLKVNKVFTVDDLCAAVEAVVGHHSMLRARFTWTAKGWTQRIAREVEGSYALNHHTVGTDAELESIIDHSQTRIDVENGPVFSVDHLHTSDGHQMMYLNAHHLVVDLLSWRVIIQDLDELLESGSLLSQRSMPFQRWNELQKEEVQKLPPSELPSPGAQGDYSYWGLEEVPNTYGDALEEGFALSEELTALLQTACNQVFQTDTADIYLAALVLSFAQTFTERPVPVVWNQEHGRQSWTADMDISETVGWFTTLCPISQVADGTDDFVEILRRLKDTRRTGPARSWQYFASKFFNSDVSPLFGSDWPFEIIFSYAGSLQHLERGNGVLEQLTIPGRTLASRTSDIGPSVGRIALFEVSAMIDRGAATVKFLYNRYSRHQDRIRAWIHNYEHLLLEAIGRLRYHTPELTLSDVPYLDVTYDGLAKLNKERIAALKLGSIRDIEAAYPATATQQSILIAQAMSPEVSHLHSIYHFASPSGDSVDTSRLCTAWQNVVIKHTALRTVFIDSVTETGLYDQVILRKSWPNMLFIDASLGEDPVEALTNLPAVPSGVGQPQHRLAVYKSPTKTYIKLDVSEALCDPQSIHVLISDLRRAYATQNALPEPTGLSYPGYIKFLESARSSQSLAFWTNRLKDVQPCIFPRLAVEHEHTQYERVHCDLDIQANELVDFARIHKASPESVLRLAWALVLRAYNGSSGVCFGYRASGREAASGGPSMRGAVGCFANATIFNLDMSPYKSLAAGIKASEEQHTASLPHQHIAVAEIRHALGQRGVDGLFNSFLSFVGEAADLNSRFTTRESFEIRGISSQETTQYGLVVNARFSGGRLVVDMGSNLMLESQAYTLANTLSKAVKAILAKPSGSIGGVDLFSDRDYAQIVAWGNEASVEHKIDILHGLVAKMAIQTPDAKAIHAFDGDLTYRQLEQYASMLAHHLSDCGVGPHVTVPVVLEKSMWAPVIMLAVMKAGGAFVPIDAEELALLQPISEQLNTSIAIGCESAAPVLRNLFEEVIVVSSDLMEQFRLRDHSVASFVTPDDIACIFFTPASTRDIKGLAFTHAAMTTALTAQGPAALITATSRVMQLSSFNVDIALAEVFTTLINGGCICIPTSSDRLNDFAGVVQRMEVNWSYMTPILARKLNADQLPTLKTVCFRTRSLDEDSWMPWAGKKRILFAYGAPDICPLGISFLEVFGPQQLNRIGQPLAGSFWVVNPEDHRKLMPVGTIGELVIEGPTLGCDFSRGQVDMTYWNSADFNAGKTGKTRYFKTGHRVRYSEGGCMEIISSNREDLTIGGKIIILAEVEQLLRRCLGQGVDVMVEAIAFKGTKSIPTLAAFIELGTLFDGDEELTQLSPLTKERLFIAKKLIETALRNSVPAYKLPSIFIPVKHLPVTPSLKVNRRKLQKRLTGLSREQLIDLSAVPNPSDVQTVGLKPLPLTESEEHMRAIWSKVLNIDQASIGSADGFLRAGGDEVLAAKLVATCRADGIDISIADVLHNATLTDLCRYMTPVEEEVQPLQNTSPISPTHSPTHVPTHIPARIQEEPSNIDPAISEKFIEKILAPKVGVERKYIKDVAEATSLQVRHIESGMLRGRANINYFVFNFSGQVEGRQLEETCQVLATIHPILRTAFVPHNRKVYQVVLKSFNVEFKRYVYPSWRLAGLTEKLVKKDQTSPIAFSSPITKFMYLDGGKQSTLVLRLSKAQYDDLSIALLVKDFKRLYDGSNNPPRRPTYCEFVRCAQLSNTATAEDYWRTFLDGAVMTSVVAHDKPSQLTNNVRTVSKAMPIGSLAGLGITFETVLKSAWAMVLANLAGSNDVTFGERIEGRHVRLPSGGSVSGVLGPTCNTVPVRIAFPDVPLSPLELLQYVHTQRITGIPYENMGFLHVIEKCTPWPYWTRFSTVVQHRHADTAITPNEPKNFHLGAAACKFSIMESKAQDVADLSVQSMMRGQDKVELAITFCENRIPISFAEETLRQLCGTVHLLTSVSMMQPIVPTGSQYIALQKQIPLPQPHRATSSPFNSEIALTQQRLQIEKAISPADTLAIQTLISNAWSTVLEPKTLGVPEEHRHNASFYDLWGSLIPAAQLASYLSKQLPKLGITGLDSPAACAVSMEDIIEHPTMLKQFELIGRKACGGGDAVPRTPTRSATVAAASAAKKMPAGVASIGKGLRKLTSTVSLAGHRDRAASTPTSAKTPTSALTAIPAAVADAISPITPTPVSAEAPRLPALQQVMFTPLMEEAEVEGVGRRSSTDEGLTEGSSASSQNGDEEVLVEPRGVVLTGMGGYEDLVSPLSPVMCHKRAFVQQPQVHGRQRGESISWGGVRVMGV